MLARMERAMNHRSLGGFLAAAVCTLALTIDLAQAAGRPPKADAGDKAQKKPEKGFRPIFDGKTFRGWEGNKKWFRIEGGALVGGSLKKPIPRNEFLCTTRAYGDFELRLKVKLVKPGGNAGIQIRSERIPKHHEMRGYQADVGGAWWGKLYDESRRNRVLAGPDKKLQGKILKPGDWNDYVIRCQGPSIRLWLNGKKTVDYVEKDPKVLKTPLAKRGVIGLQIHGGGANEAWYKDIRIKVLKPAAKAKAPKGPAGADGKVQPASARELVERTWLVQERMRQHPARPAARTRGLISTRSDAAGGVDGVKNGNYGFHTDKENKPWWQVDLGKPQPLARVVIYNRCSPDWNRASKLRVMLSEDGKAWDEAYRHDGSLFYGVKGKPLTVDLDGARARFVRVQLLDQMWLHLDEVEVYGELDPKKNIALRKPADQSSTCEWSTGRVEPNPKPATPEPQPALSFPIAETIARGQRLLARRRAEGVGVEPVAKKLAQLAAATRTPPTDPKAQRELYLKARHAVRKLILANPLLDFDKLLFVRRLTYCSSHIYTDHYDGSSRFGGNLCILSPVAPDGKVTELVPELAGGLFGRFDLSFDARKVVFACKRRGKGYRIYEVGIDGKGLRQLTGDGADEKEMIKRYRHGYDDMDPCYLPNGKIMFASTRSKRTVLCHPGFTVTSLHVMDADGKNIRCLSANTVNEFTPTMLPDGRVIYTRWEYIDKGCGDVQSLWAMRPDGSHSAHVFKNNVSRPATLIDARGIPGTGQIVAVGAPHMPLAVGPVVRVDIGITQRTPEAMTNLTPEIGYPGHSGYPTRNKGYYKEPFPLSMDLFLVAYNADAHHSAPTSYAIYLLDASGNRELVYREEEMSCFQPIPLKPRPVPTQLPPAIAAETPAEAGDKAEGTLFMQDVYQGMGGIERGRVKYLRVVEDQAKPWDAAWVSPSQGDCLGLQNPAISLKGHFAIKIVHGIVKVREDGSAHFTVPADKNLYFQALDANFMELQRMRTFVNLMAGEKRSCIGCHEPRNKVPSVRRPTAAHLAAVALTPQPGDTGPRAVHYPTDVQPVLDKHCVKCHSGAKPKAKLDLSGALTTLFSRSYENLINRKLINNIDVDPRSAYIPAEPPLTFGSHKSKMIAKLRKGHSKVKLTQPEFVRLVTWIDTNANFYGVYEGKKNIKWKDDPNFRPAPGPVACQR